MTRSPVPPQHAALLLPIVLLAACGGGGGSSTPSFAVRTTAQSWAQGTPIVASGRNVAFLAAEDVTGPAGTDFNGDGDLNDEIAVAVDTATNQERVLNVAARELAWIGNELYLVTDENEDDTDWNVDGDKADLVLLHWSAAANAVQLVDSLDATGSVHAIARGTNLFYASATVPVGAMATNVRVVSSSTPMASTQVPSTDVTGPLTASLVAIDEGLVFLALDETAEPRDLNGDADTTDTVVLGLLDATFVAGTIQSTGLALASATTPVRAKANGSHDWQVGFLVSEAAQGALNLNDPAMFGASWQPTQCSGHSDSDTNDQVLHYLQFAAWLANPVASPVRNTGLVGTQRVCIASSFIATLSLESDEGTCDLNSDGDTTDRIVRWTQIVASPAPILPLNEEPNLHAVADVPGGTRGLAELDGRFVALISEADDEIDQDGGGLTHDLLAWILPSTTPHAWDFTHGSGNNTFVGATFMSELPDRTRLAVALPENIEGANINAHVPAVAGEDTDTNDSVPTFADFSNANTLSFPGVAVAVDADNAGIVVSKNYAFYRVSEADDARDWNGDGDETDIVLFRTSLQQGTSTPTAILNNLVLGGQATPAVIVDTVGTPLGAALVVDETLVGSDVNQDGTQHFVVEYFRF